MVLYQPLLEEHLILCEKRITAVNHLSEKLDSSNPMQPLETHGFLPAEGALAPISSCPSPLLASARTACLAQEVGSARLGTGEK